MAKCGYLNLNLLVNSGMMSIEFLEGRAEILNYPEHGSSLMLMFVIVCMAVI